MAEEQQLFKTREYIARTPEEREQVLQKFRDATPAVQDQILSQLTPASPSERAEAIAPSLQWLPGMEFMHVLPESAQRTVAGYLPGITAGAIQTATSLGGAALGTLGGPAAPVTVPLLEAGGSYLGRKINVGLGLEEPGAIGDIVSVAGPLATRGAAALPLLSRASRAGRAVTQAAEETTTATEAVAARNARAQQLYEARVQQAEQTATTKTTAQEAKYQRGLGESTRRADEQTLAEQQAYQTQVQGYETAVGQHRTAKAELQAIPGQFGPETPSRTLYAAAAKANPQVELRQTAAMAEELMGTPEGLQTIQRGGVQSLAEELHELAGQSLSRDGLSYARLQKIREDLGAEVGRLRRQGGAEYRDVAKLYGALERDLGSSEASVLQAASKARRQEYAVEELASMVQTGAPGIKRLSSGAYQVDPGQLMTRAEKALSDTEKLFGGSFTADERARILQQFERHKGLAPIPRRPGEPPVPVTPRDVPVPEPVTPRSILKPVPLEAPPSVDPRTLINPPSGARIMGELVAGGATAMYGGNIPAGVALASADMTEYAISKALLSPKLRPMLDRMMGASGTISAENVQMLMNAVRATESIARNERARR
jgi:hypothetical protein